MSNTTLNNQSTKKTRPNTGGSRLTGNSRENAKLLLELAKKLNFSAKIVSGEDAQEIGIYYSIKEGLESGLMAEEEKSKFLSDLKKKE